MGSGNDFDNEGADPPWLTAEESDQILKERLWMKSHLSEAPNNPYADMVWKYFRPEVLEKYKVNKLCLIDVDSISYFSHRGNLVSTVSFVQKEGRLMVRAGDYAYVPPRERDHWKRYEISTEEVEK